MRIAILCLTFFIGAATLGVVAFVLGVPSVEAEPEKVTTEQAAAAAGAKILPTHRKLRVEPK